MNSTKHILYKTVNLVNGDFYAGVHSGPGDDGYIGSGLRLKASIKKYGKENFKREILQSFATRKEALAAEKMLVNEDFLQLPGCLNLAPGGEGNYRPYREERGARISKALTGKPKSQDHKLQISKSHMGKMHPGRAKYWIITRPDGSTERILSLRSWAKTQGLSYGGLLSSVSVNGFQAKREK